MTVTHSMEMVFPTEGAGGRLAVLWFLLQNEKYFSGLRIDFSNCIMPQLLQFFGVSWFVEHGFHPPLPYVLFSTPKTPICRSTLFTRKKRYIVLFTPIYVFSLYTLLNGNLEYLE